MRIYKKYVLTMGLVWSAALALFVTVYFIVISPQLKIRNQLLSDSAEKQKIFETAVNAANEDTKKKLADELNILKVNLSDYSVDFQESANLTFDIGRIAADKQVNSFTVKAADQSKDFDKTGAKHLQENLIMIGFDSNFRQFAAFLNALERHRPVVFVDRFKITRQDRDDSQNSVDMDLSIFVRKRPES